MISFNYDDESQSLIFYRDEIVDGIITPFPDKEGALDWAQMVADEANNIVVEDDGKTL